jgi:hypothetical protein
MCAHLVTTLLRQCVASEENALNTTHYYRNYEQASSREQSTSSVQLIDFHNLR